MYLHIENAGMYPILKKYYLVFSKQHKWLNWSIFSHSILNHTFAVFLGKMLTRQDAIVTFATGQTVIGKAGLKEKISVEFTAVEDDSFPAAATCSNTLVLPVKHTTFEAFKEKMDKALELEMQGFGEA